MIEVEIRARIKDKNGLKKKLEEIGANFVKTEKQVDRIFGNAMFLDSNKIIVEGGLSARIREVGEKKTLEFKEILRKKGGMEVESVLSDVEIGLRFLEKLKFKEAFTISKLREIYSYNDFTICLDSVIRLGEFVEIEKMVNFFSDEKKARKECVNLLNILSPNSKVENKKYGDLMQEILNRGK
ncbi:MAG: class IV adenylate cyclase [Candidatus Andersenbacteria bacterium]|nr:class IV adenylate cyclase [Candidatus Andersenbacteria bacterium]